MGSPLTFGDVSFISFALGHLKSSELNFQGEKIGGVETSGRSRKSGTSRKISVQDFFDCINNQLDRRDLYDDLRVIGKTEIATT